MPFVVKVVLACRPGTRDIEHNAPMLVQTRTAALGTFEPHPDILRQIEGRGDAFFEAEWDGDALNIGRRVEDQVW